MGLLDVNALVALVWDSHVDHAAMREWFREHLSDDVSMTDADLPPIAGHRQMTDAHLLALARRRGTRLVTFDAGIVALGGGEAVELLSA